MIPYYEIPRRYPDSTWVAIASGASLHDSQVEVAREMREADRCRVIVSNNNIFKAPWADHLHFADKQWWTWYHDREEYRTFAGVKTTLDKTLGAEEAHILHCESSRGLHPDPGWVGGNSSGQHAINIAAHYGAKRIILIGYECAAVMNGNYSWTHWFNDHPNKTDPSVFASMIANFNMIPPIAEKMGIEIINCSINTAIHCFKKDTIENVFDRS